MSKWDEYREKRKIRIDLGEIGLDGFWVVIKDPASYTLPELKTYSGITPDAGPEELRKVLAHIIIDWNLTNPNNDKELPLPSKDPKSLDVLPVEIFNKVGEAITQALSVPERKGT